MHAPRLNLLDATIIMEMNHELAGANLHAE
jgi:hypothetical protein